MRYEFKGICYACNEIGHVKRDCIGKSFKPITDFFCYNCHGFGHKVVNCEKFIFDNSNSNSRMFRGTNPTGRRSSEGTKRMRRNIVCYKCNNFGLIARNHKSPIN